MNTTGSSRIPTSPHCGPCINQQRSRVSEVLCCAAAVAILVVGCHPAADGGAASVEWQEQALIGGEPALGPEWDTVVWLDGGCTGTVIDSGTIVFAAHCGTEHAYAYTGPRLPVSWPSNEAPHVELGPDVQSFELDRCVARTTPKIGSGEDIGVCSSRDALPISNIGLPTAENEPPSLLGAEVLLVGYGPRYGDRPSSLQRDFVRSVVTEEGPELTVGDADAGTCPGDSGGPALAPREPVGWTLVGVLSSGYPLECGTGWYTPVSRNVAWIRSVREPNADTAAGCNVASQILAKPEWHPVMLALLSFAILRRRRRM